MARTTSKRKVCSECKIRNLSPTNKSGLCTSCYYKRKRKEVVEFRKKRGLCIDCGKKVNPTIIYPDGKRKFKQIKFYVKCYECRSKYGKK